MKNTQKITPLYIDKITTQITQISKQLEQLQNSLIAFKNEPNTINTEINGKQTMVKDIEITGVSIHQSIEKYIDDQYTAKQTKIDNIYKKFSHYMQSKHRINIIMHVTPQKLGVLIASIDTSEKPYTIQKRRTATGRRLLLVGK